MKKLFLALLLIAGQLSAQQSMRINQLPVKNSPDGTDSIPAEDVAGTTWRIPFSKFGAGGGGGSLPDMTNNQNKILTNNGTIANWTASPTISLSNATGLPVAGISGGLVGQGAIGTGVGLFLTAPTSANFASAVTGENGTGNLIFSAGTLNIATNKTLTVSNNITLTGTDNISINLGTASGTMLTSTGSGASLTVNSAGFNGNLLPADDTLQEIAQKLDDLTVVAGSVDIVNDTTPQLGGDLDLNGHVITGMVLGTNVQAYNANLAAIAGVTPTAGGSLPYFSGVGPVAGAVTPLTAAGRALIDDADVATQRTTLGVLAAPSSGTAGTTTFWRGDGTWAVPGGGAASTVSFNNNNSTWTAPPPTTVQGAIDTVNDKVVGSVSAIVGATGAPALRLATGGGNLDAAAVPNIDYARTYSGNISGGTVQASPSSWPVDIGSGKPTTQAIELSSLGGTRWSLLPAANLYAAGTSIRYIDSLTTAAWGRVFIPIAGNTVNGVSPPEGVAPFIAGQTGTNGSKTAIFVTNGSTAWTLLGAGAADFLQDSAAKKVFFGFNTPLTTNVTMNIPNGNSSAVVVNTAPSTPDQFVTGINNDGVPTVASVQDFQVTPVEANVGDASSTINSDGTVTSVRVNQTLTAGRTYNWPQANAYDTGKPVRFYDVTGSISATNPVTINSTYGDSFRGSTSFVITKPYVSIVLTSDHTSNWAIAGLDESSVATMPFTGNTISAVSGTLTIPDTPGAAELNYQTTLTANTTLAFAPGIPDGKKINLTVTNGATWTLATPAGQVQTETNGLGVLTIASGAGKRTRIEMQKVGTVYQAMTWLDMSASTIPGGSFAEDSETGQFVSPGTGDVDLAQGSSNVLKNLSGQFLAASSRTITKVTLPLNQVGTPASIAGNRSVGIYTDAARYTPVTDGVTNGTATVTSAAANWAQTDIGQHITGSAGIPANSYIGTWVDAHTITLSSSPSSNIAVNASAATGVTITTYGIPGSLVGTASADALASGMTNGYGIGTDFLVNATVTSGTMYHVVLRSDVIVGTFDAVNFLTWAAKGGQRVTNHHAINIASPTWAPGSAGQTPQFKLWHTM